MAPDALTDRLVVVFGASGALGAAIAHGAVRAGAVVVGADLVVPPPQRAVPGVDHRAVDTTDDEAVRAFFAGLPRPPWAVLNTVGGFAGARPVTELDVAELDQQFRLNLVTAALITKHAVAAMDGSGRIVHTSSRAAVQPSGTGLAYGASKLSLIRLVELAALDTRKTDVTVNCVLPSIIDTPANRAAMPNADHDSWPKPEQLADVYLFLASPQSSLISGAAIPVYGKV